MNIHADAEIDGKLGNGWSRHGSILAYDADWQYPAITEKHAYAQALKLLPSIPSVVYFAFPWATLLDKLDKKESADSLLGVLADAKARIKGHKHVITVCQHINMLRRQRLFARAGITHVFWSHAVRGQERFPHHTDIQIHPFPLYPVQALERGCEGAGPKRYLYSFVGARANQWYLTGVRNHIIDHLSKDGRGIVVGRDRWHFHKIVYDHQIHARIDAHEELIDQAASAEYKKILEESTFSLCPSGSGPNSIRLWESIGCGAIPVILSDTYLPPGNQALWDEAVVSCPERLEDVRALPDRLEALARDEALLERKRHALRRLWMLYGPDCFIHDIQKLFLSLAEETADISGARPAFMHGHLLDIAAEINRNGVVDRQAADMFILGCNSRVLTDPAAVQDCYRENEQFRTAYTLALKSCDGSYSEAMRKVLEFKGVLLDPHEVTTGAETGSGKDTSVEATLRNIVSDVPCFNEKNVCRRFFRYPAGDTRYAEGGLRLQGKYKKGTDQEPLVTVVTVCLNSQASIEQCMKSVFDQTYGNIEYIIIDGGSRDGTLDIIGKHKDLVDYYVSEPDKGLYHAMNKGVALASGDYVLMLNSDDWYAKDCVESLVQARLDTGADFVSALTRNVGKAGKPRGVLRHMPYDDSLRLRMPLRHETMLISADIYDAVGCYDERYPILADFHFTIRLFEAGYTLYELQRPLLFFRTSGVSSMDKDGLRAERVRLMKEQFPYLEDGEARLFADLGELRPDQVTGLAGKYSAEQKFTKALERYVEDRRLMVS